MPDYAKIWPTEPQRSTPEPSIRQAFGWMLIGGLIMSAIFGVMILMRV